MNTRYFAVFIVMALWGATMYFLIVSTILPPSLQAGKNNQETIQESTPNETIPYEKTPYENTVTAATTAIIAGARIMIAALMFDLSQYGYFDVMFDSFRDLCECGASIHVVIYTAMQLPPDIVESLQGRMNCRYPGAQFNVSVIIKNPSVRFNLCRFHRKLFYEKINDYDLFIYTEDDLHIRPRHVVGYLEETVKLQESLGDEHFTDYSIGFLRYEREPADNYGHYYFEHRWKASSTDTFATYHLRRVKGIPNETYFHGNTNFHQGMYMATREQLLAWAIRPNCKFNDTFIYNDRLVREKVSSMHLFSTDGCNVTQLVPTRSYQDFLIHHMPDKYIHDPPNNSWKPVKVERIASFFPRVVENSSPGGKVVVINEWNKKK